MAICYVSSSVQIAPVLCRAPSVQYDTACVHQTLPSTQVMVKPHIFCSNHGLAQANACEKTGEEKVICLDHLPDDAALCSHLMLALV